MEADRTPERARPADLKSAYRRIMDDHFPGRMEISFIETAGGTPDNPDVRWKIFEELISSPRLPSGLL